VDKNVGSTLAEEGLGKAFLFVQSTKFQDPFTILSETIIVEHKAGKIVAVAQQFEFGYDVLGTPLAHLATKEHPLCGLTEITVVFAASSGDDGQEWSWQVRYEWHFG
jgi:hypothetical protein